MPAKPALPPTAAEPPALVEVPIFAWLCEPISVLVVFPEPIFVERSVLNESLMLVVLRCE
ncbi:Uncharacterised protein [Mycobacteroides abscessus subsp. abscessus]|nr:Uncharacterised protein [Mycobacteroides abscessus subsp. abscessus]